jgi:hypothetical protein
MDLRKCQQYVEELARLRDEAGANRSPSEVRGLLKRMALIYDLARNSEPTFAAGIFQAMATCLSVAESVLEPGIAAGSAEMAARQERLRQALDFVVTTGARISGMAAPTTSATPPTYQAPPVQSVAPAQAPFAEQSATAPPTAQTTQRGAAAPQEAQIRQAFEALKRERDEAIQAEVEARTEYHTACQQLNRLREENTALQGQIKRVAGERETLVSMQALLKRALAERETLQRDLETVKSQAEQRERADTERIHARDRRIEALQRQSAAEPDPSTLQSGLLAARDALPALLQRHVDGLLELMPVVEQGDAAALEAKIDAIDRWVYQPPEAVGVLMAKGLAAPAMLHQVVAAQRLLHTQLAKAGLVLICPAAGDPFDAALHLCPERDIVYINEGPHEDRVLALTHIGFRSERSGAVLRRALVKRSVYVGDLDETEPALAEPNRSDSATPTVAEAEMGIEEAKMEAASQEPETAAPESADPQKAESGSGVGS